MKLKQIIYLLSVPLIVIIAVTLYKNSYVEFEPVIFENNGFKKIIINGAEYKNVQSVLDYYGESNKVDESGALLIKRSLSDDKELLSNYIKKALDEKWLHTH